MKFIDRKSQNMPMNMKFIGNRVELDDNFFDGETVPDALRAKNWHPENVLHASDLISHDIKSTRNFLGQNENIIRDDLRRRTIASFIHGDGALEIIEMSNSGIKNKNELFKNNVLRNSLSLDKYSGKVFITTILKNNKINFDGTILVTSATLPDFPFFEIAQVSIGHIPQKAFEYGILTYKCRASGNLYIRKFENENMGEEITLVAPETVGGAGIAISGDNVLIRIDSYIDGRLTALLSRSDDKGKTFSEFKPIELPYDESFELLPASAAPMQDYAGAFHVPLCVANEYETILLDYIENYALVEAIRVNEPKDYRTFTALARFPKTSACDTTDIQTLRFGDGVTDGIGIIATLNVNGNLYASNSQSGGISYPEPSHLNHEMPLIRALSLTECYTKGDIPNTVSMDYLYVESTKEGGPLCPELHFETWEMPLPKPVAKAFFDGKKINIVIEKDANFFHGKTAVKIDDPLVEILDLTIHEVRKASIVTSSSNPVGKKLTIEVNSQFHHHSIDVFIEK